MLETFYWEKKARAHFVFFYFELNTHAITCVCIFNFIAAYGLRSALDDKKYR